MKEELEKKIAFFEKTVGEFEETIIELIKIKEGLQRELWRVSMDAKEGDLVEIEILLNSGKTKTLTATLDVIRPNGDIGFISMEGDKNHTFYPKFIDLKVIEKC
jgi:ketol-acid reductoisomerase